MSLRERFRKRKMTATDIDEQNVEEHVTDMMDDIKDK